MTTAEIDASIQALNAQKAALAADLEAAQQSLEGLSYEKSEFRTAAIRHGDTAAKVKLNELRTGIAVAQMAITDITEELAKVDSEIAELQTARIEAVRWEAWQEFLVLSEEVKVESMNLDELLGEFFKSLAPHAEQLRRMNQLMARAGVDGKGYSLEVLRRCVDEKFRLGFIEYFGRQPRIFHRGNIFENPYSTVIAQRVEAVKQRRDGVVVDDEDERAVINE